MVLDTSLLNTRQYKVRIKGKVEQFWERSSALPLHLGVVAIEKGAFWSPSTKGRQLYFTYFFLNFIRLLFFYSLSFRFSSFFDSENVLSASVIVIDNKKYLSHRKNIKKYYTNKNFLCISFIKTNTHDHSPHMTNSATPETRKIKTL